MKVQGMVDPGSFTVERIPGSGRSLVRLFQNVTPVQTEDFTGYEYDEYHVEVETWDGIAANVRENYETFLRKGMDNEIDRSNRALYSAQVDTDAMNVDQEFRLTLLELGLTELADGIDKKMEAAQAGIAAKEAQAAEAEEQKSE